jgi:transposase
MGHLITMSTKELNRIQIIERVVSNGLNQTQAAETLGVSPRQMRRLIASYKDSGALALTSKKRGKPSNHRLSDEIKQKALELIKANYYDFGPTLANEKLLELHGIHLSIETVRKLMADAGFWKTRIECYGELVQIDGSEHHWFEKRGPKCTLLVYIDDATSRLMELQFVPEESTFSYFESTKRYLQNHGKPVAFYSDKLSVFRVNAKDAAGGDRITQFGRALKDLNIDIICANTPQAKGKVERANKTLQDRLIKEMRLRNISTIEQANCFMKEFIEIHNNRFGKIPVNPRNAHRELLPHEKLEETFCWQEDRTLSHNLTFQYNKILYLIEDTPTNRKIARKRITVYDYPDGSIEVRYEGRPLPYSILHDRLQRVDQGEVVENKRLSNVLAFIQEKQAELNCERSKSVPKRHSSTH